MQRILIIDDDVELSELVEDYLTEEGFSVEAVHNGAEGIERALSGNYQIVLLDVMMPIIGGLEVLRRIRSDPQGQVPVLMLTARGDDVDRIIGLEVGADDYLPKPFNSRELVARIRAILRRTNREQGLVGGTPLEVICVGDVELSTGTREVKCRGESVNFTSVEFDLLEKLLREAGSVVSREALGQAALGRSISPLDRSIDMHISSLRRKLGHQVGDIERIKTVRAAGYQYANVSCEA